jgi:hypothetical protein
MAIPMSSSPTNFRLALVLSPSLGPVMLLSMVKFRDGFVFNGLGMYDKSPGIQRFFSTVLGKQVFNLENGSGSYLHNGKQVNVVRDHGPDNVNGFVFPMHFSEFELEHRAPSHNFKMTVTDADAIMILDMEQPQMGGHAHVQVKLPAYEEFEGTGSESVSSALSKMMAEMTRKRDHFHDEVESANFIDQNHVKARLIKDGDGTATLSAVGATKSAKPDEVRRILSSALAKFHVKYDQKQRLNAKLARLDQEREDALNELAKL